MGPYQHTSDIFPFDASLLVHLPYSRPPIAVRVIYRVTHFGQLGRGPVSTYENGATVEEMTLNLALNDAVKCTGHSDSAGWVCLDCLAVI